MYFSTIVKDERENSHAWSLLIINPRMRSEGYTRVTVLGLSVCLSVCLSVDAYSGTTGYEAAYELYKRVQIYKGLKNTSRFS